MDANKTLKLLRLARSSGCAVAAVNCYNYEAMIATVAAAEAAHLPAIVQVFPWALHAAPSHLLARCAVLAASTSPWTSAHIDHVQTIEDVRLSIELGFDSIMVDMSHHSHEDNIRLTSSLTQEAHANGIAVEAEMGRIDGSEEGVVDAPLMQAILTDPAAARHFVDSTKVDMLAPAVGNLHGNYPRNMSPRRVIQVHRLEAISRELPETPLVLHGYSDFDDDLTTRCIAAGIAKININKTVHESMNRAGKRFWTTLSGDAVMPNLIEGNIAAFQADITSHLRLFSQQQDR
ncbi:hypothetical protein PYCC9005_002749 [Savitreella phatthalungensis]